MIADNYTPYEPPEAVENNYRECALKFARTMSMAVAFITENNSPHVAAWAVAHSLGLSVCEGRSLTDTAAMLNVSPQAISKQARLFVNEANISDDTGYLYKKK
jgi:hypothetical protein